MQWRWTVGAKHEGESAEGTGFLTAARRLRRWRARGGRTAPPAYVAPLDTSAAASPAPPQAVPPAAAFRPQVRAAAREPGIVAAAIARVFVAIDAVLPGKQARRRR